MTLCKTLLEQESEWRKHSVYPLHDDSDRDFEFYVLVDPGKDKPRPVFLEVLESAIRNPDAKLEGEPLSQFKEWTGSDDGSLATAINWIKIAIEQYPMRLFVVRQEVPSNNLHPFLKKRICWLTRGDFEQQLNGNKEQFKLWLHAQWVKHLIEDVVGFEQLPDRVWFIFPGDDMVDRWYRPATLPDKLATAIGKWSGSVVSLSLAGSNVLANSHEKVSEVPGNAQFILWFTRHHCFWEKRGQKWSVIGEYGNWAKNHTPPIYSENLSGALSYWGRLLQAFERPDSPSSISFLFLLTETALLRVGIADERFQEWWNNRDEKGESVGFLIQQRLISLFWEKPEEYNQPPVPPHRVWATYQPPTDSGSGVLQFNLPNQTTGIGNLWKEDQRQIDVIVVHQGILDKWKPDFTAQRYTQEVLKWKEEFPFVVVTSGRGRPENVPFGVKFLPFSGVEASMVGDRFEKLTLLRQVAVITEGRK